jgi:hypothetical protein
MRGQSASTKQSAPVIGTFPTISRTSSICFSTPVDQLGALSTTDHLVDSGTRDTALDPQLWTALVEVRVDDPDTKRALRFTAVTMTACQFNTFADGDFIKTP